MSEILPGPDLSAAQSKLIEHAARQIVQHTLQSLRYQTAIKPRVQASVISMCTADAWQLQKGAGLLSWWSTCLAWTMAFRSGQVQWVGHCEQ